MPVELDISRAVSTLKRENPRYKILVPGGTTIGGSLPLPAAVMLVNMARMVVVSKPEAVIEGFGITLLSWAGSILVETNDDHLAQLIALADTGSKQKPSCQFTN